jgi:carbamoyl-phosphate synthase small subunit
MDLAKEVTTPKTYTWKGLKTWKKIKGFEKNKKRKFKIVAIDFGIKKNILRYFSNYDCEVKVVSCKKKSDEIFKLKPHGVFLSNGPGDPAATGKYAIKVVKSLIQGGLPLFGICLGHQILALALNAKTRKMKLGHRGANHPVKNLITNKVEITSQNHGFEVIKESLKKNTEITHLSLFDNSIEGIRLKNKPVFSVQYHPEANPGPQDSKYLFSNFMEDVKKYAKKKRY